MNGLKTNDFLERFIFWPENIQLTKVCRLNDSSE